MPTIFHQGDAIVVPDHVAADWARLTAVDPRPTTFYGHPLRPRAAGAATRRGVTITWPAGIYVDWQDDAVRRCMYEQRMRDPQPTSAELAETFGPFEDDLRPYRAADAWARRIGSTVARGTAPHLGRGNDHRRWSEYRAAVRQSQVAQAAGQPGVRVFGVEIEFNYNGHDLHGARRRILADLTAAGLAAHDRWNSYGWSPSIGGWQGTYDSTVNGGELVTPPLVGDDASMGHLRLALDSVRRHGGTHEASGYSGHAGMHVSHTVVDFTRDDLVRLTHNLEACGGLLHQYLGSARRSSGWCRPMDSYAWSQVRQAIARGQAPMDNHGIAFNFGSCFASNGAARVEFRGWGNSLNFTKTRVWVRVGQAFMAATKAGVTFGPGVTMADMIATLRQHGLSDWAADRWMQRTGNVALAA